MGKSKSLFSKAREGIKYGFQNKIKTPVFPDNKKDPCFSV
jgi:hypothetical protein